MLTKLFNKLKSADFILVTISTVVCSMLSFVLNVYSKHEVESRPMGIYSACLIVLAYMNYAQLGVLNHEDFLNLAKKAIKANDSESTLSKEELDELYPYKQTFDSLHNQA